MKRLTATFPDSVQLNLTELMAKATEFKVETITQEEEHHPARKVVVGLSVPQAVMRHFTPRGQFTNRHAEKWVESAGFNPSSASPACRQLEKLGCLRRIGNKVRNITWEFVKPWDQRDDAPTSEPKLKAV